MNEDMRAGWNPWRLRRRVREMEAVRDHLQRRSNALYYRTAMAEGWAHVTPGLVSLVRQEFESYEGPDYPHPRLRKVTDG